jgi:dihydroorotate dehydrogenase
VTALDLAYRHVARPVLFRLGGGDAETAHARTLAALSRLARHPALLRRVRRLLAADPAPRTAFGLTFPNPVGLAAGADKDGVALAAWPALGFGFVEAGTVTAVGQPGNPRPRVFRLTGSQAVINRMGFPNAGAAALAARIAATGTIGVPLGISLGKSKVAPIDDAVADYLASLRAVEAHADYIAVNVSSPNTPGLRGLQDRGALDEIVAALTAEAAALAGARAPRLDHGHDDDGNRPDRPVAGVGANVESDRAGGADPRDRPVPILVKIAPDLTDQAIADVLQVCHDRDVAGVIATNTTVARNGVIPGERGLAMESGGLSGRPLAARALEVVRFVCAHTDLPVIGVGGITRPDDALAMFDAGATLVQLYTALLYQGPGLLRDITFAATRPASGSATDHQEEPR